MGAANKVVVSAGLEIIPNGRPHQAVVACYIDF